MEHPSVCLKEHYWGEVYATMKNINDSLERIENKMLKHIEEGERPVTGTRDRVSKLEWEVSDMKKRFWWSAIVGGMIGALVGSGSAEALTLLINFLLHK